MHKGGGNYYHRRIVECLAKFNLEHHVDLKIIVKFPSYLARNPRIYKSLLLAFKTSHTEFDKKVLGEYKRFLFENTIHKVTLVAIREGLDNLEKLVEKKTLLSKFTSLSPSLASERVIDFCAFLLHKDYREIFIGDIKETRRAMLKKGWSKGWVNLNTFLKILSVIKASMWVGVIDFFHSEKERNK